MHNKNCLRGGKWGGKQSFWGGSSHPSPPHGGATEDDHHSAIIHTSLSENQEVPRWLACSGVQSNHTDEVLYSVVKIDSLRM